MKNKILAIIPARGENKGIPRKNIRLLAGKPLIAYSIEAALKSKYIDGVVVSIEDKEVPELSRKQEVEIIEKSKDLAIEYSHNQSRYCCSLTVYNRSEVNQK